MTHADRHTPEDAPASRSLAWRMIVRQVGALLGGQGSLWAAKFGAQVLLARVLGAERFAECAVYLSTSAALSSILDLGLNVTCVSLSAGARPEEMRSIWGRVLQLRLLLAAGAAAAVLPFAGFLAATLLRDEAYATALRLGAITAIIGSLANFTQALLQVESRFPRIAKQNVAGALAYAAAFAIPAGPIGLATLFLADLLSRVVMLAVNVRVLGTAMQGWWTEAAVPYGRILAFSNWITLSTAVGSIMSYAPVVILSRAGASTQLAAFSLGMTFAGAFTLLLNASMSVLMPIASRASGPDERRAYIASYLPVAGRVAMVLALLVLLGVPVVELTAGSRVPGATLVFLCIGLAQVALLLANPIQFLLYGSRRPELCTASDVAIALLYIAGAAVLAPRFGAPGVAAALLFSQTLVKAGVSAGIALKAWKEAPSYAAG